jgi:hypothetical protein
MTHLTGVLSGVRRTDYVRGEVRSEPGSASSVGHGAQTGVAQPTGVGRQVCTCVQGRTRSGTASNWTLCKEHGFLII